MTWRSHRNRARDRREQWAAEVAKAIKRWILGHPSLGKHETEDVLLNDCPSLSSDAGTMPSCGDNGGMGLFARSPDAGKAERALGAARAIAKAIEPVGDLDDDSDDAPVFRHKADAPRIVRNEGCGDPFIQSRRRRERAINRALRVEASAKLGIFRNERQHDRQIFFIQRPGLVARRAGRHSAQIRRVSSYQEGLRWYVIACRRRFSTIDTG